MQHALHDHPFGILMYHRVAPRTQGLEKPTWNVTPERFGRQLHGLLSRGYRAWPLRRLVECRRAGLPIPRRTFAVTFDDGYESVFQNAWPILKELSVPATVFLSTAYLDSQEPFPCDDWMAAGSKETPISSWRPLSGQQCLKMIEGGLMEIGSHTHSHLDFRGDCGKFHDELLLSQTILKERFGLDCVSFAFPYGHSTSEMVQKVRDSGMYCALTVEKELVRPGDDPFAWGRFEVKNRDTTDVLVLKLNGYYTILRNAWKRFEACFHR